jgi:hypothetical protein
MKIRSSLFYVAITAVLCAVPCAHAQQSSDSSSQDDVNSAIQSLRADIGADKVAIIRDGMQFTPQESDIFWPIYKKYAYDMSKVNDDRVALVKEYADKYSTLTDADAKEMVGKMLAFEQNRVDVNKKYFKEFSSKLSGQTVAKFFQLEHRMDLVVDLELASHLPALLDKPTNP